ncbi:MAG TPA: DUF427 domain-containing protein [Gemmatimonadota bacterium]|nr:DUF427 domain-containing protein [Gemmatimonadota bacterium]
MPKAYWNGAVIADSDETIVFEGRHYFPPGSVHRKYLQKSQTRTSSSRVGRADFYHLTVNGDLNADAAWSYHKPKAAARHIQDYVAFWHGVEVE